MDSVSAVSLAPRKLVLDTNVWLDWLVFGDRSMLWLEQLGQPEHMTLLGTAQTRDEFLSVLPRPAIARRLLEPRARQEVAWRFESLLTLSPTPARCALTCTDSDDQIFIDLALAQGAFALLTRDKALLSLARRASKRYGLLIVTPSEYRSDGG